MFVKSTVEISQNFVAISEYMNFKRREKMYPVAFWMKLQYLHTNSYKEGNFYKYVPCVHTLKYWENASGINKISVLKNN